MEQTTGALAWEARVALWDAALHAVRAHLRGQGLREVSTPVRVRAQAVEPFIDPVAAPPGFLATSPELAMKRLLCRGSGSIFQISHVFRRAEIGDRHREEFHLVEWYRAPGDLADVLVDVEALVARVFEATGAEEHVPRDWRRVGFFDVVAATCGARLRGDEDAAGLIAALPPALAEAVASSDPRAAEPEVRTLMAWTALFTAWSDAHLDGWLAAQGRIGVHLVEFPAPLAALAQTTREGERALARRAESHVAGVELANGYLELRDPAEQRRRFDAVNGLRVALGQPALPLDEPFLAELASPGLPPCAGMALGLDRLLMLAAGVRSLADVSLALGGV